MKIRQPAILAIIAALAFTGAQAADESVDKATQAQHDATLDRQTAAMQAMHERMMAARTPEERQALMGEHMKVMQDAPADK